MTLFLCFGAAGEEYILGAFGHEAFVVVLSGATPLLSGGGALSLLLLA